MKVTVKKVGENAYFEGTTESGHSIRVNSPLYENEEKQAPTPMEALLIAVAGCTSVDIVLIMNKMKQNLRDLSVEVEGEREEINDAKPFRSIDLTYIFEGDIDEKRAKRATKLSVEKYCSVIESLHPDVTITWRMKVNR